MSDDTNWRKRRGREPLEIRSIGATFQRIGACFYYDIICLNGSTLAVLWFRYRCDDVNGVCFGVACKAVDMA